MHDNWLDMLNIARLTHAWLRRLSYHPVWALGRIQPEALDFDALAPFQMDQLKPFSSVYCYIAIPPAALILVFGLPTTSPGARDGFAIFPTNFTDVCRTSHGSSAKLSRMRV